MSLMAPAARMIAELIDNLEAEGLTRAEAIDITKGWWLKQEFLQGYLYAGMKPGKNDEAPAPEPTPNEEVER